MAKNISQNDFDKCITIYDAMHKDSKTMERDGFTGDVWQGKLVQLFGKCNIATPYYTPVMNALKEMGCVIQLRRGGGTALSEWILYFPPSMAEFRILEKKTGRTGLKQSPHEVTNQKIRDVLALVKEQDRRIRLLEDIVIGKKEEPNGNT